MKGFQQSCCEVCFRNPTCGVDCGSCIESIPDEPVYLPMSNRYITPKACKCCGMKTSALMLRDAGRNVSKDSPVFYSGRTGGLSVKCRGCGIERAAKMVKGTISEKHQCSDRCLSSTGFSCECSCGGTNHGAAHA